METFAATASALPESAAARWRHDRLFYAGVTAAAIAVVLAGFGPTYYFGAFTGAPILASPVHFHAALYSVWMILFAIQVSLVAGRRVALHRKLGTLSMALAIVMVWAAWFMAVEGARFQWAGPRNPRDAEAALRFLIVPLGDLTLFVGFFGAAFLFRHRPETHKRLMVLAMIGGAIAQAFARLPIPVTVVVWSGLLLAGPLHDRLSRGRVHGAYAWGVPIVFFSMPVRLAIAQTDTWRRVSTWLIS